MIPATPTGPQPARVLSREADELLPRDGREVAGIAEALYRRLFTLALGGLQLTCLLAVIAAVVRTDHANFARTVALAVGLASAAALAMRNSERCYWAIRRRPALALTGPILALAALTIDGISHSPLSFAAAASIALPAFVCGRRWALTAATIISLGAVAASSLRIGWSALSSVGQGTVAYFVWAIVLAGLAESFARLAMRMPYRDVSRSVPPSPMSVTNLAGDPSASRSAQRRSPVNQPQRPQAAISLTARQLQVVALLADGLRARDIANQLGISPSTVYMHVKQAKQRAGVNTRDELIAATMQEGLLATDRPRDATACSDPDPGHFDEPSKTVAVE